MGCNKIYSTNDRSIGYKQKRYTVQAVEARATMRLTVQTKEVWATMSDTVQTIEALAKSKLLRST